MSWREIKQASTCLRRVAYDAHYDRAYHWMDVRLGYTARLRWRLCVSTRARTWRARQTPDCPSGHPVGECRSVNWRARLGLRMRASTACARFPARGRAGVPWEMHARHCRQHTENMRRNCGEVAAAAGLALPRDLGGLIYPMLQCALRAWSKTSMRVI